VSTALIRAGTAIKPKGKPRGRPFEIGNRANPSGRPPGIKDRRTLKPWLLKTLDATDESGTTLWEMVAQAVVVAAAKGDMQAFKELRDTIEGRPPVAGDGEVDRTQPAITLNVMNVLREMPPELLKKLEDAFEAEVVE
jgi:hypothetical protein